MKQINLDHKVTKAVSDLEDARRENLEWVTERLIALTQTESSESVRDCYQQIAALRNQASRIDIQHSLERLIDSEKKSLLFDFKGILAAWRNLKSLEKRQKVQVNIQISKEAKKALEALSKKHRVSQGQVIESYLLKSSRARSSTRTSRKATSPADTPNRLPQSPHLNTSD